MDCAFAVHKAKNSNVHMNEAGLHGLPDFDVAQFAIV